MKDNEHLVSMHPMIPGESVLFLGETREGVISLSNFRYVTDQIILKEAGQIILNEYISSDNVAEDVKIVSLKY